MTRSKIAAVLASTALTAGAGIGVANAASSGNTSSSTTEQQRRGPTGPSTAQLQKLAAELGVTTAQLRTALESGRGGFGEKPRKGQRPGRGDLAAALAKELGVTESAVLTILDANRPAKPKATRAGTTPPARGQRPPRPDESKLVAALADGLKLDSAKVKAAGEKVHAAEEAAHDAEHAARETERATALAKALGIEDVAKVKAALAKYPIGRGPGGPGGPGGRGGHGGPGGPGGPPPATTP